MLYYADCHYAQCHYAECRGTKNRQTLMTKINPLSSGWIKLLTAISLELRSFLSYFKLKLTFFIIMIAVYEHH